MDKTRDAATEAVAATDQEPAACPFCGCHGSADVMHDEWPADGDAWFARCSTPGCIQINEIFVSRRAAIAAWNTRADASTIATLRKALEDVREIASDSDTRGWLDFDRIVDIASAALDEKGE